MPLHAYATSRDKLQPVTIVDEILFPCKSCTDLSVISKDKVLPDVDRFDNEFLKITSIIAVTRTLSIFCIRKASYPSVGTDRRLQLCLTLNHSFAHTLF